MDGGTIKAEEVEGIVVFRISGYFNEATGVNLRTSAMERLKQGKKLFVLDLAGCNLMNSPGVASVLKVGIAIKEDFLGSLVICGASPILSKVLTLAEVSSCAALEANLPAALKKVREG